MKTFICLWGLVIGIGMTSCHENDKFTEGQANSKASLYGEISTALIAVDDKKSSNIAIEIIAKSRKQLQKIHQTSQALDLDDEQLEKLRTITDVAVEKMLGACDGALMRVSKDKKAHAALSTAIEELFADLESFEK